MASGNIFKLLAEIKALKLDYAGAVRYLTDKGVEVTGIIKQGLNNFFKKNKARDVDFGSVVKKIPYDDFNVPFNPNNPLKNYSKGKDGVGTLFKNKSKTLADELAQAEGVETFETILPTKKLPDIKMGSRINYEAIADKAGIDVELIRGKNWEEIMEIIKGKADGGRVGFEIGGLSGEAQSIYDAWLSAGHSEADTLDYLTSRGMYNAGEGEKGITSILNTQPGIINQGGDNLGRAPVGQTISDFQTAVKGRQDRLQDPNKLAQLIGNYIPQQRSAEDLLASGVKDARLTSNLPLGMGAGIAKMLPDKYYDMPRGDQSFIQSQMGYTDPETNMANKDPFGINTRSAFGNYADYVTNRVTELEEIVQRQLNDPRSRWNMNNPSTQMKQLNYYRPLAVQRRNMQSDAGLIDIAKREEKKKKAAALILATQAAESGNILGPQSHKEAESTGGDYHSDTRSTVDGQTTEWGDELFSRGGLATMFTRRR